LSLLPTKKKNNISGTLTIKLFKHKILPVYHNPKYCTFNTNTDGENLA